MIAFITIAMVIFFAVVQPLNAMTRRRKAHAEDDSDTRPCTECLSEIPRAARKCAYCASPQEPHAAPA